MSWRERDKVINSAIIVTLVFFDAISKFYFSSSLSDGSVVNIVPGFRFILVHNYGAGFGFLASAGGWQQILFISITLIFVGYMGWKIFSGRPEDFCSNLGFAFICGGALGNFIDRIKQGYVTDFIDIYFDKWHWPVFNLADTAITIGAVILIYDIFFYRKKS